MEEQENIEEVQLNQNIYELIKPSVPEGKVRFETRIKLHPNGSVEREVWINDEKLDWSIDIKSFHEAVKMGLMYQKAVKRDIVRHFVESVSDLVGRKVTMQDVNEAIQRGWI